MFDEMKKALREGKFVALVKTGDGGVRFAGSYDSDRIAYSDFSADSPEGISAIPEVIFVKQFQLPPPPMNL
jgi:hypothetical protein